MPLMEASSRAIFASNNALPPRTAKNWKPIGTKTMPNAVIPNAIIGNIWFLRWRARPTKAEQNNKSQTSSCTWDALLFKFPICMKCIMHRVSHMQRGKLKFLVHNVFAQNENFNLSIDLPLDFSVKSSWMVCVDKTSKNRFITWLAHVTLSKPFESTSRYFIAYKLQSKAKASQREKMNRNENIFFVYTWIPFIQFTSWMSFVPLHSFHRCRCRFPDASSIGVVESVGLRRHLSSDRTALSCRVSSMWDMT